MKNQTKKRNQKQPTNQKGLDKNKYRNMLEDAKKQFGIKDDIKLGFSSMKTEAASISLRTNVIRLNKNIINDLSDEEVKYLIYHELTHYVTKSKYHNYKFYKILYSKIPEDEAKKMDAKIISSILKLNKDS